MTLYPNAKINIGLNIVEKRADGYHNLESFFYPIGIHDCLQVEVAPDQPSGTCIIDLHGIAIDGKAEDNLVVCAYNLLHQAHQIPAVRVRLEKLIPMGAGLGGGSSDAAYMLKALNELFALNISAEQLEAYAATLGADCAFFIQNRPVYVTGIGNEFHHDVPVPSLSGKTLLLVKPDVFVSTRDAYSMIRPQRPDTPLADSIQLPIKEWRSRVVNDFEISVFPKFPLIREVKEKIYQMGATYASMSGSGSTVFGIFDASIDNAEAAFRDMYTAQIQLQ